MTLQTVEYVIRARFQEPPDNPAIPEENRIGDAMFDIFSEIEMVAEDQEIVSRMVDPDRPRPAKRQQCPTSAGWHGKHYVTDRRWTLTSPSGCTVTVCSVACMLTWLVFELPADVVAQRSATPTEAA